MTTGPRNSLLWSFGLLIGFAAAFLGIGGGIAVVPLLVLGFKLDQRRAAGTSLGVVTFVVAAGVAMDFVVGTAETRPAWIAFLLIAPTAVVASRVMTPLIRHVPTHVLRQTFAVVLLVAAVKLFGLPPFRSGAGAGLFSYEDMGAAELIVLPLLGLCVGTVSTLVGIGGGLLVIPSLGLLFHDLNWLECRSTSLLIVVPTALMGFTRHLRQGTADPQYVWAIAPACVVGSLCGSWTAHGVDTGLFQRVFGAVLVLICLRLLLTGRERA